MYGVFEVRKDGLEVGLAAVSADDIGGRPIIAIGDEDDASQPISLERLEGSDIKPVGQAELSLGPVEFDAEDLSNMLASYKAGFDIPLDACTVTLLLPR